jgi:hypothetical protein
MQRREEQADEHFGLLAVDVGVRPRRWLGKAGQSVAPPLSAPHSSAADWCSCRRPVVPHVRDFPRPRQRCSLAAGCRRRAYRIIARPCCDRAVAADRYSPCGQEVIETAGACAGRGRGPARDAGNGRVHGAVNGRDLDVFEPPDASRPLAIGLKSQSIGTTVMNTAVGISVP